MPIPDYQTLMLPLLKIVAQREVRMRDVLGQVADVFGLTQAEREERLPSGRQGVFHNRLHWAKFYMSKAGLIESPRYGCFVASDAGRALLARNPTTIDNQVLLEYPAFKEFYRGSANGMETQIASPNVGPPVPALSATVTPEEQIEAAHLALQSALREELLQRIAQNSPGFFKQVIVDLLVAMGYGGSRRNAATQLGRAGDGGVDGVINEDRLGLDRVYVQAKRYGDDTTVGRPDVQAFVGSLVGLGATKGVFVTTSSFTTQASIMCRGYPNA